MLDKQIYEKNHPNSLRTKHRIANCLEKIGKLDEAICLYKQIEFLQLEKLGESHPHYIETLKDRKICEKLDRKCLLM